MSKQKSPGNPYKVLYWMGAGLLVLVLGVVVLAINAGKERGAPPPDPERTMLWLYDVNAPEGPAVVTLIEESRSQERLMAVPFAAPDAVREAYGGKSSKQAQQAMITYLDRQVHHRVFLPFSVVATLIDAAGGVDIDSKRLKGEEAVAWAAAGQADTAARSSQVMMALADAVSARGVSMSMSEGLKLARYVDTDIDLTAIPDLLARWSQYENPLIAKPEAAEAAAIQKLLLPDQAKAR